MVVVTLLVLGVIFGLGIVTLLAISRRLPDMSDPEP